MARFPMLVAALILSTPALAGAACATPDQPIDEQGFVPVNGSSTG